MVCRHSQTPAYFMSESERYMLKTIKGNRVVAIPGELAHLVDELTLDVLLGWVLPGITYLQKGSSTTCLHCRRRIPRGRMFSLMSTHNGKAVFAWVHFKCLAPYLGGAAKKINTMRKRRLECFHYSVRVQSQKTSSDSR